MAVIRLNRVLAVMLLISGCGSSPDDWQPSSEIAEIYSDSRNRLIYKGPISDTANQLLFQTYQGAAAKPKVLAITSTGGSTRAGLDLGEWLETRQFSVEVEKLCASSCANYVLPAASEIRLHPSAVLLWHGSLWQEWDASVINCELWAERYRESAFFDRIGVDNLITVLGQQQITFLHRLEAFFGDSPIGFDYSIGDLNRMGLRTIRLVDDKWNWRKYHPDWRDDIFRAEVPQDYQFKKSRFLTDSAKHEIERCVGHA